jgi:hypothetical protein|tara:strand:+ start:1210 stop:1446 length:237 start_codon:yes stop_codon:yes gene_type:complete
VVLLALVEVDVDGTFDDADARDEQTPLLPGTPAERDMCGRGAEQAPTPKPCATHDIRSRPRGVERKESDKMTIRGKYF